MKRTAASLLTVVPAAAFGLAVAVAGPAHADSSPANYPPSNGASKTTAVLGTEFTNAPATDPVVAPDTNGSALPFTGADVVGTTVLGVVLVAGGAAAIKLGRRARGTHR